MSDKIDITIPRKDNRIDLDIQKTKSIELKVLRGSGGTSNYNALTNKPQINEVELSGNKSIEELGITTMTNLEIKAIFDKVFNK